MSHRFLTVGVLTLGLLTGAAALSACGSAPSTPATGGTAGTAGAAVPAATGTADGTTTGATSGAAAGAAAPAAVASAGASAAAGVRVDGIPAFLAVPPGAKVTGSAVGHKGSLLQVSITGSTSAKVADVLAFYRRTLTAAGFTSTDDRVLPTGSSGTAYGRGDSGELLVVAVVDRGTARSFSVGGTIAAG